MNTPRQQQGVAFNQSVQPVFNAESIDDIDSREIVFERGVPQQVPTELPMATTRGFAAPLQTPPQYQQVPQQPQPYVAQTQPQYQQVLPQQPQPQTNLYLDNEMSGAREKLVINGYTHPQSYNKTKSTYRSWSNYGGTEDRGYEKETYRGFDSAYSRDNKCRFCNNFYSGCTCNVKYSNER